MKKILLLAWLLPFVALATKMDTLELTNPQALASLGTPVDGTVKFCTNCSSGTNPCAATGSGALARRENGAWNCGVTMACGSLTNAAASCSVDATNAVNIGSGTLPAGRLPAFTGDATSTVGTAALTFGTVNGNVGSFGSSSQVGTFTVNGKGLITAAGNTTITPAAIGAPSGSGTSSGTNTGDLTLTAVGAVPNLNAASLSGQALTLQPANATNPGVVTIANQTFTGNKITDGRFVSGIGTASTGVQGFLLNTPASTDGFITQQDNGSGQWTMGREGSTNAWVLNSVGQDQPIAVGKLTSNPITFSRNLTTPLNITSTAGFIEAGVALSSKYVPQTRTVTGTAPITVNGVNTAVDYTVNHTVAISAATTSAAGSMSAADKLKLNGIWRDAVADCGFNSSGGAITDAAWQACYDAFPSTGGVLYFPPGTYDLALATASTITPTRPVLSLGAGRTISAIQISHASKTGFTSGTGSNGMGFEQIRFTAPLSTTRTGGFMWDMAAIPNTYGQQFDCIYSWSCIRSAGPLQFVDDANIREFGANAANGQAVLIEGTGDRYIRRLTTDNPSDPTGAAGVRVRECSSLVLSDSNIINSTNALDIVPNAGVGHAVASVLAANTFFDSSVIGVNILPATANDTAHRIRLVNSWFGSNTTANVRIGNGTIPNANIASVDILGSDFFSNSSSPFGLDVQGATDWSVRASRFGGHTTGAIRVAVGTGSADQRFNITDNLIGSSLGVGVNAQGITIGAGTYDQYQILDNRALDKNTTPGISDSGVVGPTGFKNVSNNIGALVSGTLQPLSSGGAAAISARAAVTSGTGETFLMTYRIPANAVQVGQMFRWQGWVQSSAGGTLVVTGKSGATGTIASDTAVAVSQTTSAGAATSYSHITIWFYIVALGSSNTVAGDVVVQNSAAAAPNTMYGKVLAAEALANTPTTAPFFLTISATAAAGTYTVKGAVMEAL